MTQKPWHWPIFQKNSLDLTLRTMLSGSADITALRESPTRSQSATVPRGSIIGVQKARGVHGPRPTQHSSSRRYRGRTGRCTPSAGQMMAVCGFSRAIYAATDVLPRLNSFWHWSSITLLGGVDSTAPLLPFLRRAYVERAGIVLVRVGAEDSANEMRADRLATRNLLDPRLDVALDARPGRATPLAHGLFLALQALQHALRHGEGNVRRARLVVVTDGRGNVPLELDSDLNVVRTVGRVGVENALEVAASIRAITAIETFLVDPQPDIYPELVSELAQALGAELVPGRPREPTENVDA